jgi:hypothetical protein
MYYLVCVDHNGMAEHLTRMIVEGINMGVYTQCSGWDS